MIFNHLTWIFLHFRDNFSLFFPWQVCEAAAPAARPALHRPQVSGASLLLQVDRRHAHRHFPHGDAGGSAPDHMTPATPPPSLVNIPAMSAKMKKEYLIQIVKQHILYLAEHCN